MHSVVVVVHIHAHTGVLSRPSFSQGWPDKRNASGSPTAHRVVAAAREFEEVHVVMAIKLTSDDMSVLLNEFLVTNIFRGH